MDEVLYQSKSQKKRIERTIAREDYLKKQDEYQRVKPIQERWEQAQITAAGWQSVLDHAVNVYNEHKEELEDEIIKQTEEQIAERQEQIKEFLMSEKDAYLEAMGIQAD